MIRRLLERLPHDAARDLRYGRRGGGWVDQGHDPHAPKAPIAERGAERPERGLGGQDTPGRARMAHARQAAQPVADARLAALAARTDLDPDRRAQLHAVLAAARADVELDALDRQALAGAQP